MADVIARLRGKGADGRWLAAVVEALLAGKPLSAALGVDQIAWAASRHRFRDDALRALAAHFPGPIAAQAKEVRRLVRRYEIRWHRVDRHRAVMPAGYGGKLDELLYTALAAACGRVPMSRSQCMKSWAHQVFARLIVIGRVEADNSRLDRRFVWSTAGMLAKRNDDDGIIELIAETPTVKRRSVSARQR